MNWFRSHHGAPTDPKWSLIAHKAGAPTVHVVALFWSLLDYASQHEERGSIAGFDTEVAAMYLQIDEAHVVAILQAMRDKGVLTGERITNWHKRQPKREREDDNSTERVRAYRERQRQAGDGESQVHHVSETPVKRHETPRNAQTRQDKTREEQTDRQTPLPPSSTPEAVPEASVGRSSSDDVEAILAASPAHWRSALEAKTQASRAKIKGAVPKWQVSVLRNWQKGDGAPEAPPPPPRSVTIAQPEEIVVYEGTPAAGWSDEQVRSVQGYSPDVPVRRVKAATR